MDIYAGTLSSAVALVNRMSKTNIAHYYVGCEIDRQMMLYAQFRLNSVWRARFEPSGGK